MIRLPLLSRRMGFIALLCLLGIGLGVLLTDREKTLVTAHAHSADGEPLSVDLILQSVDERSGAEKWSVNVRNTICRTIRARATIRVGDGIPNTSNECVTRVRSVAKDVRLVVDIKNRSFGSIPASARRAGPSRKGVDETVVIPLGDMDPGQEKTVVLDLSAG